MTWLPPKRDDDAEKARFIELYGQELWDQIQAVSATKPLAAREVFKPKPPTNDRPALQTEDSGSPRWWDKSAMSEEDKPRGLCHPDDLEVLKKSYPEYDWAPDRFCPPGSSYDQDSGRLIARIARGIQGTT